MLAKKPVRRVPVSPRRNILSVANDFARASLEMDNLQMRLLLLLALRDQKAGGAPRTHRISLSQCRQMLNLPRNGQAYLSVKSLAENIANAAMWRPITQVPEGFVESDPLFRYLTSTADSTRKYYERVPVFDRVLVGLANDGAIESEDDEFIVRFNSAFEPMILQLQKSFAQVDIDIMFALRSSYAQRFYFYCCSWHPERNPGAGWTMTLEELILWLEIPKTMTVKNIRKAVIEYAQEKLDEAADLSFDFTVLRAGRNITGYRFVPRRTRRRSKRTEALAAAAPAGSQAAPARVLSQEEEAAAQKWWAEAKTEQLEAFFKASEGAQIFRGRSQGSTLLYRLILSYLAEQQQVLPL